MDEEMDRFAKVRNSGKYHKAFNIKGLKHVYKVSDMQKDVSYVNLLENEAMDDIAANDFSTPDSGSDYVNEGDDCEDDGQWDPDCESDQVSLHGLFVVLTRTYR
ncbi:hypothetical protein ACOMHN_025154 [Nucella lapillus]